MFSRRYAVGGYATTMFMQDDGRIFVSWQPGRLLQLEYKQSYRPSTFLPRLFWSVLAKTELFRQLQMAHFGWSCLWLRDIMLIPRNDGQAGKCHVERGSVGSRSPL